MARAWELALVLCMAWVPTLADEIKVSRPTAADAVLTEGSYVCYNDGIGGLNRRETGIELCATKMIDPEDDTPYATASKNFGILPEERALEQNLCDCQHWHRVASSETGDVFAERNGHATTVFKNKIWLTGGRSKMYSRWDNGRSQRRADVWSSPNGRDWTQELQLLGDFEEQNADVLIPGPVAPWWERFGHTMTTYHATQYNLDGTLNASIPEVILLFGGFAPNPMNDLWVTQDGVTWNMVFKEPYYDTPQINKWPSPRGYHGSAVFNGSLWVVSGSPLNNEVWSARDLTLSPELPLGAIEGLKPIWWTIKWTRHFSIETIDSSSGGSYTRTNLPFMPRAGAMIASQPVLQGFTYWGDNKGGDETTDHPQQTGEGIFNQTRIVEYLYVMGGFGAWHEDDPRYDGERARNDVWRTSNGNDWVRLDILEHDVGADRAVPVHSVVNGVPRGYRKKTTAGAPWAARAFGSLETWSIDTSYSNAYDNPRSRIIKERHMDVTRSANKDSEYTYLTNKGLPFYKDRMAEFDAIAPTPPKNKKESYARRALARNIRSRWKKDGSYWAPRIWLSGGGFFGRKGNNDVQTMEAYVDLWWTRDGVQWYQVVDLKGISDTLYSSSECFYTEETSQPKFIGKYGHTMAPLTPQDSFVPALFFIAGDMVDDGPILSDTFQSSNGILCDVYGSENSGYGLAASESSGFLTCNGHGVCERVLPYSIVRDGFSFEKDVSRTAENATEYIQGCRCDAGWTGEYCEGKDPELISAAPAVTAGAFSFLLPAAATTLLLFMHSAEQHRQKRSSSW